MGALADWPVARRLFTVIVVALLMGLVFGGLRVAAAEGSASSRVRKALSCRMTETCFFMGRVPGCRTTLAHPARPLPRSG